MKDIQAAITIIDRKIGDLKEQARDFVKEVAALLKKVKPEKGEALKNEPKPKRIWIRFKETRGYETFSIVSSQVLYYDKQRNYPLQRDIVRGQNYKIPKVRFFQHVRGYASDIQDVLWSYEERFGEIRKHLTHLSRAREQLQQLLKEMQQSSDSDLSEDHQSSTPGIR